MIKVGMMIADRYEVIEKIGTGGMSDVYRAKDHKLNRFVAVKVLKQEFSENADFVSKFRTEAQAAAGLMHPNIVNVYDVGEESGFHYIVMELVEGITLKKYIEKKARLSVKEAVSIAIQVSMGIESAHNNHIIHRDIKPQNIIISKEGKVKVTDFGIAKAATSNTVTSSVMGSVHYTSPEQVRGGFSDEKSDIYSLGISLFEMLTGRVPFNGESTVAVAIKHIQEEMPSPRYFVPEIPISVEQIVLKCTQKSPDKRYQSAPELIEDLKRSLISPDENFVKIDNEDKGATKTISNNELKTIKRQSHRREDFDAQIQSSRVNRSSEDDQKKYNNDDYAEEEYLDEEYSDGIYDDSEYESLDNEKESYSSDGYSYKKYSNEDYPNEDYPNEEYSNEDYSEEEYEYQQYEKTDTDNFNFDNKKKTRNSSKNYQNKNQDKAKVSRESDKFSGKQSKGKSDTKSDGKNGKDKHVSKQTTKQSLKTNSRGYSSEEDDEDDYDPKMEFLTTVLIVIAAIIIGCIFLYIVARAVGINMFSGSNGNDTNVSAASVQDITMPDVYNMEASAAEEQLRNLGLTVTKEYENSSEVELNHVISASESSGTILSSGASVNLVISSGADNANNVAVPDIKGLSSAEATAKLENEGFTVVKTMANSDEVAKNNVISQNPEAGTEAIRGASIEIVISLGEETVEVSMPNLLNMSEEDAIVKLTECGLTIDETSITEEYSDSVPAGSVCYQNYSAGLTISTSSEITIKISKGPEQIYYNCQTEVNPPSDYAGGAAVVVLKGSDGSQLFSTTTDNFPVAINVSNILAVSTGEIYITYNVNEEEQLTDADGNVTIQNVQVQKTTGPETVAFTRVQ